MQIDELVRKEVIDLSPYAVTRVLEGTDDEEVVKLDLNENFALASSTMGKLLHDACRHLDPRLYPPPYGEVAIRTIARFFGFRESEISVGNGADEVLDLLMKVFVNPKAKVLVVEPTFPLYSYFTRLHGGTKVTVPLRPDFGLDVDAIFETIDKKTVLLVLCSPNNPTGNQHNEGAIKRILEEFNGVVVVDEAYVDFAKYTVVDWVRDFNNLVVLRTFSKAFGLAGLRCGFLVSNKAIVDYVKRVTSPFHVNTLTQRLVARTLQNWTYFQQRIQYVIDERERLRKYLDRLDGITPFPSDANFILCRITKNNLASSIVAKRLKTKHVWVKDRGDLPFLSNCIRVTVGTRQMNDTFLSALEQALED